MVAAALIPWITVAAPSDAAAATGGDAANAGLDQLFTDEQAFTWKEDPLTASYDGQRTYDDRMTYRVEAVPNLRAFHDAVLDEGTQTLPMLERQIDAYVTRARSASTQN